MNLINAYPSSALPDITRGAVEDIVNVAKVSPGLAGAAVLTAMSVAIQRGIKIVLPSTQSARPCGLYQLIVAAAGEGKTPAYELAMKAIREHDASARAQHDVQRKHHRAQMEVWVNQKRLLLTNDAGDAEVVERLQRHYETEPVITKCRSLVSQDISERAVLEALNGSGRSLGIICDEGKILLKDSFQEKVGVMNAAWSGSALQLERANGVRLNAQDPRVTMSIMVQPDVWTEYLTKRANTSIRGSGLLSRCLPCVPQSKQGYRWRDASVPTRHRLDAFHDRIREILLQGDAREESRSDEVLLEFDADAAQRWLDIGNNYEVLIQPHNAGYAIRDFLSKAAEQIARIAALFHVISAQPGKITADTVERARVLVEYYANEFTKMFVPPPPPPAWIKDSHVLDAYLYRAYWSSGMVMVPKNDVLRSGPVRGRDRFEPALNALISAGKVWLHCDEKRKVFIFRYVNQVQSVVQQPPMMYQFQ
ncbi:YfjI family protein [Hydrogenophaga sp. NH-16]|uniref:YfjI family protein n=1 Tax=Hydrogenophaga sp. NH-16 TaxID=2184519 RepID=UPI0013E3B62B|nr:YfjI family protein [Hydrogenophaga sp. NH-16]